jgi:chorismate dehydratase
VKIGAIGFINTLPLYSQWSLPFDPPVYNTPTQLNRALLKGTLTVSPISSVFYWQHQDQLALLPGLSVSSLGSVRSVLLLTQGPPPYATVGVPDDSATSVGLLRLYLQAKQTHYPPTQLYTYPANNPTQALAAYGAILMIGDRALTWHTHTPVGCNSIDLAQWWTQVTGLPFVFAVWAANRAWLNQQPEHAQKAQQVMQQLCQNRDAFYNNLPYQHSVISQACGLTGLPYNAIKAYYTQALNYGWTPQHDTSLVQFGQALGALPVNN